MRVRVRSQAPLLLRVKTLRGIALLPRSTFILLVVLPAFGCNPPAAVKPNPHYALGDPYKVGPIWYYPRETLDFDETGLAAVTTGHASPLTANGEMFDQTALAGGHPTLQLPAIARLTNLENGREVTVRLNDRGSGNPRRLLEVTSRAAALLQFPPGGVARVRLRLLPVESQAAAGALPGSPTLALTAAPRGGIQVAELPPLPGLRMDSGGVPGAAASMIVRQPPPSASPPLPPSSAPLARLPETVTQTQPSPTRLMVRLDTFDSYQYAAMQQAKMAALGAFIIPLPQGRSRQFRVEIGPLPDVAQADAVLDQALASGIPDARIMVE